MAIVGTGDDADEAEMTEGSTTRKNKGRPGRKPGQKSGKQDDESEHQTGNHREESDIRTFLWTSTGTGEDDNEDDEHEGQSPSKKAKGKPGRKPVQTNKKASKADHDQEAENDNGTNQCSIRESIRS